jgi:DNA-binding beta-propeller fold protein YncE
MTRTFKAFAAAGVLALSGSLFAQNSAPDIAFDSTADLLKTPANVFVGEVGGVGQNSKGQIYVYTRTGHPYATLGDNRTFFRNGSRLYEFDKTGKYVRELGQDVYGFNAAFGLRVDPQDNVWTIDAGANQVVKFDAEGHVALVLGRKPEAIGVRPGPPPGAPAPAPGAGRGGAADEEGGGRGRGGAQAGPPGSGIPGSTFNRPSDVAWDKAGNIYIADGMAGNVNRIAKFARDGNFIKQWGSTGSEQGQFKGPKALAVDAQGNVYVLDAGNKRVQVFDGDGTFKSQFGNIGSPLTMCMTSGSPQYLYISHSGDADGMEDAAILKTSLDGKVVGKFGSAGKLPKQFGLANSIDCRTENELLVGEMSNWRVQKVALKR